MLEAGTVRASGVYENHVLIYRQIRKIYEPSLDITCCAKAGASY